jgi:hypothetical protein
MISFVKYAGSRVNEFTAVSSIVRSSGSTLPPGSEVSPAYDRRVADLLHCLSTGESDQRVIHPRTDLTGHIDLRGDQRTAQLELRQNARVDTGFSACVAGMQRDF